MVSKEFFKKGIEELEIAFDNFMMTKARANVWYKYSKDLTNDNWLRKIENCIKYCRKTTTFADILDLNGYYKTEYDWSKVKTFTEDELDYKYTDRPKKITKEVYKVLAKVSPKYRDKLAKLESEVK